MTSFCTSRTFGKSFRLTVSVPLPGTNSPKERAGQAPLLSIHLYHTVLLYHIIPGKSRGDGDFFPKNSPFSGPPGRSDQEQLAEEHADAAQRRHREQIRPQPGGHHPHPQGQKSRHRALGGLHDGGEGHDRQGDVGHIVEEGLDEAALDGPAEQTAFH